MVTLVNSIETGIDADLNSDEKRSSEERHRRLTYEDDVEIRLENICEKTFGEFFFRCPVEAIGIGRWCRSLAFIIIVRCCLRLRWRWKSRRRWSTLRQQRWHRRKKWRRWRRRWNNIHHGWHQSSRRFASLNIGFHRDSKSIRWVWSLRSTWNVYSAGFDSFSTIALLSRFSDCRSFARNTSATSSEPNVLFKSLEKPKQSLMFAQS